MLAAVEAALPSEGLGTLLATLLATLLTARFGVPPSAVEAALPSAGRGAPLAAIGAAPPSAGPGPLLAVVEAALPSAGPGALLATATPLRRSEISTADRAAVFLPGEVVVPWLGAAAACGDGDSSSPNLASCAAAPRPSSVVAPSLGWFRRGPG